jgi:CBS domain-containing protein
MATARDILERKGAIIYCISADSSVLEATVRMNQCRVGALIVTDEGQIVGIFTERDVLRRVVAQERAAATTPVRDAMSDNVICCGLETGVDEIAAIMRDQRIRHMPVCDEEGELLGIISLGDVNAFYASNQASEIHFLNEYIYGRV